MRRFFGTWIVGITLVPMLLFPVLLPAEPAGDMSTLLSQANQHLNDGAYQPAKENLDSVLTNPRASVQERQRAHLLLIKLYVLASNDAESKGDDFNAQSNLVRASEEIRTCLETPELRHTLPEPPQDFPKQMAALFDQERALLFASFQVKTLEPENALVILDGDTLSGAAGALPVAYNVYARRAGTPVEHTVIIKAEGFKTQESTFEMEPGQVYTPEFSLERGCGFFPCWTLRGGVVLAALGIGALLLPGGDGTDTPDPLPGPPEPPGEN